MKLLIDYRRKEIVAACKTDTREAQDFCLAVLEAQDQILRDSDEFYELVDEIGDPKYMYSTLNWWGKIKRYFSCVAYALLGLAPAPAYYIRLHRKAIDIINRKRNYFHEMENKYENVTVTTSNVKCTKTEYLDECQREIQVMLSDFIGKQNTPHIKDIIKIKTQDIINRYIQEGKLPDGVKAMDFDFYIESFTKLQ